MTLNISGDSRNRNDQGATEKDDMVELIEAITYVICQDSPVKCQSFFKVFSENKVQVDGGLEFWRHIGGERADGVHHASHGEQEVEVEQRI